ncbi:MAG: hypothetical protein U0792_02805 [Gemmataceae bacterium]
MNVGEKYSGEARHLGALDSLLRCELSAVETYDQAMMQFSDAHVLADLQRIREDHVLRQGSRRETGSSDGGHDVVRPSTSS